MCRHLYQSEIDYKWATKNGVWPIIIRICLCNCGSCQTATCHCFCVGRGSAVRGHGMQEGTCTHCEGSKGKPTCGNGLEPRNLNQKTVSQHLQLPTCNASDDLQQRLVRFVKGINKHASGGGSAGEGDSAAGGEGGHPVWLLTNKVSQQIEDAMCGLLLYLILHCFI